MTQILALMHPRRTKGRTDFFVSLVAMHSSVKWKATEEDIMAGENEMEVGVEGDTQHLPHCRRRRVSVCLDGKDD